MLHSRGAQFERSAVGAAAGHGQAGQAYYWTRNHTRAAPVEPKLASAHSSWSPIEREGELVHSMQSQSCQASQAASDDASN
jgi:hypothetical protein